MWKFVDAIWTIRDSPRTGWAASGIIYDINYVLVCIRPEMAMEIGFTKWNRCSCEWLL